MITAEGREKISLALVKPAVKLYVLKSCVVYISAQKPYRKIEYVTYYHNNYTEHYEHCVTACYKRHGVRRNDVRDYRARKHKPVKPCIAENVGSVIYYAVSRAEALSEFAEKLFLSARGKHRRKKADARRNSARKPSN